MLLAELGLGYLLDWTNDDQPYRLNVPGMLSVPYSVELNDLSVFISRGLTGPDFVQLVKDQLDQLLRRLRRQRPGHGARAAPVRGRPAVSPPVPRPGARVCRQPPGVWLTTSDEIAEHYCGRRERER